MEKEVYSFSKLSAWHQCPLGWRKSYLDHHCSCGFVGTPDEFESAPRRGRICPSCGAKYTEAEFKKLIDRGMNNAFAEFGSFCHEIFENYANGEYELSSLADIYDFGFDSAFTTNFPKMGKTDLRQSYYDKGLAFFQNWGGYPGCKLLAAEEHFVINIADFQLQGFIDLQYEDEDGKLICLDYKSKASFKKGELEHYARQPYLYSEWMKQKYGRYPDVLRFFLFRENKFVDVPWTQEGYDEAMKWAVDTVDEIRNAWMYVENPDNWFCTKLCGHRMDCEYGNYDYWKKE